MLQLRKILNIAMIFSNVFTPYFGQNKTNQNNVKILKSFQLFTCYYYDIDL